MVLLIMVDSPYDNIKNQPQKSIWDFTIPMTDPAGAASCLVCHGSHQEIPPVNVSIYTSTMDPSWDML